MLRWIRHLARGGTALGLVLLLVATAAAAQPRQEPVDPERLERAHALDRASRERYAEGRYEEARALLEQAVSLDPEGGVLHYNLGVLYEKLGQLDRALGSFRRALELESRDEERARLGRIITRVEGASAHTRPRPRPPAPPPLPPHESLRFSPWTWVAAAGAGAAFTVSAALGIRAVTVDPGAAPTTGPDTTADDLHADARSAHAAAIGADVAFALGCGAGAATAILLVASARRSPPEHVTWHLALAPGGGSLAGRF